MKILRTNQFISERIKVKPITNAEWDDAKKCIKEIATINIIHNNFKVTMGTTISSICIDETNKTKKITPAYIITRTVYDNFKVKYVEIDSEENVTQDKWQPIRKIFGFLDDAKKNVENYIGVSNICWYDSYNEVQITKYNNTHNTGGNFYLCSADVKDIAKNLADYLNGVVSQDKIIAKNIGILVDAYKIELKDTTIFIYDGVYKKIGGSNYKKRKGFTVMKDGNCLAYELNSRGNGFIKSNSTKVEDLWFPIEHYL